MSPSKPHQQLYRPGSGPLRKSAVDNNKKYSTNSNIDCDNKNAKQYKSNIDLIDNKINEFSLGQSYSEELGSTTSLTDKRKYRKPQQALYVPKRLSDKDRSPEIVGDMHQVGGSGSANNSGNNRSHFDHRHRGNYNRDGRKERNNDNLGDNHRQRRHGNRGKYDYDNDRRNPEESWRSQSPSYVRRDFRQASEPRLTGGFDMNNRVRDTRSVEPMAPPRNWNHNKDKMHNKPPSGRRNSTVGNEMPPKISKPLNFDSLPPRLKNKFLKQNGFGTNNGEEPWDGSSVTFQGQCYQKSIPQQQYQQMPPPPPSSNTMNNRQMPSPMWSQTLPNMRGGRGRGRIRHEDLEMERICQAALNRQTSDRVVMNHSRPTSPLQQYNSLPRTLSNESLPRCPTPRKDQYPIKMDRMYRGLHTPPPHVTTPPEQFRRNSISMDSPPQMHSVPSSHHQTTPHQLPVSKSPPLTILDWSEEVELCAEIEECMSDALTRSSSMASLVDYASNNQLPRDRKNRRRSPNRERDNSLDNESRQTYRNSSRDRDNRHKGGYHSRDNSATRNLEYNQQRNDYQSHSNFNNPNNFTRDRYHDNDSVRHRRRRDSRDSSGDRSRRNSERDIDNRNWREEMRFTQTQEKSNKIETPTIITTQSTKQSNPAGILVLPRNTTVVRETNSMSEVLTRQNSHQRSVMTSQSSQQVHSNVLPGQQKKLFDHQNPNKPIVVHSTSARVLIPDNNRLLNESTSPTDLTNQTSTYSSEKRVHLKIHSEIKNIDYKLQWMLNTGEILRNWSGAMELRNQLQQSLIKLLQTDLKYCQTENVEQHFWKMLYHNIHERLKEIGINQPEFKQQCKECMLKIIEDGTEYYEQLLKVLENSYSFRLEDFLGSNSYPPHKGLGFIGLALVSAQKIYIFLGDLARYKEQLNETCNYGISRQYYINAQQLNPKNGRPYYQLAIIANFTRRKLDAVYYYMRSLMTSNPFSSARENLGSLFDDIRRKYEQTERKRREEKIERAKLHMKERERSLSGGNSLRREIWIHPEGRRRRVHRTTSTQAAGVQVDTDDEDISKLTSSEVNKRFVVSYLHVHGKLNTKIGMETFQDTALQMLKEFRVLLQHSPFPLNSTRLLQLLALNMFAIENAQLKEQQATLTYRSEVQECALVVSLQMFNLILERCNALLKEQLESLKILPHILVEDLQVILPAIKVWCDWMLCHKSVWYPPPSCSDYKNSCPGDVWNRLAVLMNLLEKLDYKQTTLVNTPEDGYEVIRLPEDAMLCGFTPLMLNSQELMFVQKDCDMEVAQICLRITRILFFGTTFLCGITPPVLKLQKFESGYSEYISVIRTSASKEDCSSAPDLSSDSDILVESFSEEEEEEDVDNTEKQDSEQHEEIRELLQRKEELERRQKKQERHRERVQAILQQSVVSVQIEVSPRLLVPDTNCFIDYLSLLKTISEAQSNAQPIYILSVPLVVFNELEGLARGGKSPAPTTRTSIDPAHIAKVAEAAKTALEFLRSKHPAVRCVTSRGAVVPLHTYTLEEEFDQDVGARNDDRILATSLSLCRNTNKDQHNEGEPRHLYREVVLLTDDRNLRVKALARDVPVRELPDFMKWAGLG